MTPEKISPYASWNVVFAQYTDGSSWTSDRTAPVAHNGATLWFRGKRSQQAVFAELEALGGMLSTATDVLFTGTSAGGLAVFLTAERVRSYFTSPSLRFVAMPDSGFFLDSNTVNQTGFTASIAGAYGPNLWNSSSGTNQRCVAATPGAEQWRCMFAPYVYPAFTKGSPVALPFFVSQSGADLWQTQNVLALPCTPGGTCNAAQDASFAAFQDVLRGLLTTASAAAPPGDALYLTGCLQHGQTCSDGDWFTQARPGGSPQAAAFAAWYGGGQGSQVGPAWPAAQACYVGAHGWC